MVLDACVLYPTVLREILLGAARVGLYEPLWSERIFREWVLAAARIAPDARGIAEAEAALARAEFPRAMAPARADIEARLTLPDPGDIHVLASAIAAHADGVVTFNAKDFPRPVLAEWGIERRDPDGFLWELHSREPQTMARIVEAIRAKAEALSGVPMPLKTLMKRVRLHRLGRALGA